MSWIFRRISQREWNAINNLGKSGLIFSSFNIVGCFKGGIMSFFANFLKWLLDCIMKFRPMCLLKPLSILVQNSS